MRPRPVRLCFFAAAVGILSGCGTSAPKDRALPSPSLAAPRSLDRLPDLIALRLTIATEVALAKHATGAPVHDPAREAALLTAIIEQGLQRGLPAAEVETFFSAQIAASRQVQVELLAAWADGTPLPDHAPLDLRADIRPRLDALTPRMLDALATQRSSTIAETTARQLAASGFSPAVIALATAPLR